jgi:hypothetical protein
MNNPTALIQLGIPSIVKQFLEIQGDQRLLERSMARTGSPNERCFSSRDYIVEKSWIIS